MRDDLSMNGEADFQEMGISVVFLHYNRPWSLEIAMMGLRKKLQMERIPFEIILADDGSHHELREFLTGLPFDQLYFQQEHEEDSTNHSIYHTLTEAYQLARYPFLLFLEDDFWVVPQGFRDREKNHLEGLLAVPDYSGKKAPFRGAVELLNARPEVGFVEMGRGFQNPRYDDIPGSEVNYAGVKFRAKSNPDTPRFYSCAWPHMMRAEDARSIPMPLGSSCWSGERVMVSRRQRYFGDGNWVYNPELSYFIHINIFTWREVYNRKGADSHMRWADVPPEADLPYTLRSIPGYNNQLLQAFNEKRLENNFQRYQATYPLEYIYERYYRDLRK